MTDPSLGLYGKLKWWYSGQVAEAVHEYEDRVDAILQPTVMVVVTAVIASNSHAAMADGSGWVAHSGALGLVFSAIIGTYCLVLLGASVTYATETTELPKEAEQAVNGGPQ